MLHPAAVLVIWLSFALVLQSFAVLPLLILLLLIGGVSRAVRVRWLVLLRRARWLLLTLWVVLAYSVPGVLWRGLEYLPSQEGLGVANLHFLRLVVLLGSLAALLTFLPRPSLMAGLWSLVGFVLPQSIANRSVVRLQLVLDYVEHPLPAGGWRSLLLEPGNAGLGTPPESIAFSLRAWRIRDTLVLLSVMATLLVVTVYS